MHLMLASILLSKQLSNINQQQICQNSITINSNQYNYCLKTQNLNQLKLVNEMFMSQKYNQQIFLYTENTKYSIIDMHVNNYNVNSFSLFGFVSDTQNIMDSQINISLHYDIFQGALICIKCDVQIMNCTLIFVATGAQISALVIEVNQLLQILQSFVQYRAICSNSSGLINIIYQQINLSIIDCKLTGGNLIESNYSGFIASVITLHPNLVTIKTFFVCVNNIPAFGNQSISVHFDVNLQCDICGEHFMVYGLCLDSLQYGQQAGGTIQCVNPFMFSDNQCVCAQGYILDKLNCVDILQAIRNMTSVDNSGLLQRVTNIERMVQELDSSMTQNVSQIISYIQITQSTLESHIVSNYSSLDASLQQNTSALDKRISGNATLLAQTIVSNASALDNFIYQNSTVLDWRIYNNISALNYSFTNTTNTISQNIQALQFNLTTLDNFTKTFQQNQSQQNQEMKQVITSLGQEINCLNNAGTYIEGLCLANYTVSCSENSSCSQLVYFASFDQYFITYSISPQSNFSSGYIFSTASIITNAFIDVSDNVQSSKVNPLFQSQSTFTNLKIQFGAQTLSSGSFISTQSSVFTINQLNIVSRSGSQLTVNADCNLNILFNSPTGAEIKNLLVNLSFVPSNGNITLILSINGVFNISGYQVLGDYSSTLTVAMIGINVQTATININQVNFRPNIYNVGNGSSYLFQNTFSGASTFEINNLAVIIGNESNFLLMGSISTTQYYTYQFGGILAYINSASSICVYNVVMDSYQKFSSQYVACSGFLLGFVWSSTSSITIKNLCLLQNMPSTTVQFVKLGIIGYNSGNVSLLNSKVTFFVQGAMFQYFGVFGDQSSYSNYVEVINLITSVSITTSDSGAFIGSIFGLEGANDCSIQNTTVIGGNISSGSSNNVGGIIGQQHNQATIKIQIYNSSVQNISISGQSKVGGIIGKCQQTLYLTNVQIKFLYIVASSNPGVVVGYNNGGTLLFVNSTAVSNYIKGIKQSECVNIANNWSASGC
ncbi:Growth_factor receptor cysteine-rich domain superfamily [Hexamita inflata]|uniref:Growth_factor receptor cysteine-rich domain superfamily n=1 Tax=Hexamita inflata TaxID=28002 RepID=A0ABP1KHM6_9EUKA